MLDQHCIQTIQVELIPQIFFCCNQSHIVLLQSCQDLDQFFSLCAPSSRSKLRPPHRPLLVALHATWPINQNTILPLAKRSHSSCPHPCTPPVLPSQLIHSAANLLHHGLLCWFAHTATPVERKDAFPYLQPFQTSSSYPGRTIQRRPPGSIQFPSFAPKVWIP